MGQTKLLRLGPLSLTPCTKQSRPYGVFGVVRQAEKGAAPPEGSLGEEAQ